jgi:hypothetical protein
MTVRGGVMSQFYGLLAGLFVCASTWGAMTYISEQVGWLTGVFLLVFFTVTTVYINGDEVNERQKSVVRSLADMEIIFFEKLKMIERKIDYLEEKLTAGQSTPLKSAPHVQELDDMIGMVEQILEDRNNQERGTTTDLQEPTAQPDAEGLLC